MKLYLNLNVIRPQSQGLSEKRALKEVKEEMQAIPVPTFWVFSLHSHVETEIDGSLLMHQNTFYQ